MSWARSFSQTVMHALNPKHYTHFTHVSLKDAFGYFLTLILVTFFAMSILWIPSLLALPETLTTEFEKFNELSIEIMYDQREPVVLTKDYPLITIDMKNEYDDIEEGLILITKDTTFYRFLPYGGSNKISDSENLLENSDEMSKFLAVVAFMAVPMVMAYAYIYFVIKYTVVVALLGLIGFVLARVVKFDISFADTMRASLFGATPMILLGMLTKPFIPSVGYLDYIVFVVYLVLGCLVLGEFEADPIEGKKTAKIDLENVGKNNDRRGKTTETQSVSK